MGGHLTERKLELPIHQMSNKAFDKDLSSETEKDPVKRDKLRDQARTIRTVMATSSMKKSNDARRAATMREGCGCDDKKVIKKKKNEVAVYQDLNSTPNGGDGAKPGKDKNYVKPMDEGHKQFPLDKVNKKIAKKEGEGQSVDAHVMRAVKNFSTKASDFSKDRGDEAKAKSKQFKSFEKKDRGDQDYYMRNKNPKSAVKSMLSAVQNEKKAKALKAVSNAGKRMEGYAPGDVDQKVGAVTSIPKEEQDSARERLLAKAKKKREAMKEGHCDTEGVKCSPTEKKKDSKTMKKIEEIHVQAHSPHEVPSDGPGTLKKLVKKATKRIDADVDGDVDTKDPKFTDTGEFIPDTEGRKKKIRFKFESAAPFHSWRDEIREVVDVPSSEPQTDDKMDKEVKEKKVKNKVIINPPQAVTEAFAELGGTIIEMAEVDEAYYGGEEQTEEVDQKQMQQIQRRQIQLDRKKLQLKQQAARQGQETASDTTITSEGIEQVGEAYYGGEEQRKKDEKKAAYEKQLKRMLPKRAFDQMGREIDPRSGKLKEENIEEVLNMKKADMGDVVKDFYKSDAPQFKGKSKEKRRQMAIAAKLEAERGPQNEKFVPPYEPLKTTERENEKKKKREMLQKTADHDDQMSGRMASEETINELNRYEKETGTSSGSMNMPKGRPTQKGGESSPVMRAVRQMMRSQSGKPMGQRKPSERPQPKTMTPAQKVANRRAAKQRSIDNMSSRYD